MDAGADEHVAFSPTPNALADARVTEEVGAGPGEHHAAAQYVAAVGQGRAAWALLLHDERIPGLP